MARMYRRPAAAVLGVLGGALLVISVLTGLLSPGEAAVAGAFAACLAALALLVLMVRRLDGKAQRIDLRVKKYESELARTTTTLKRIDTRLDTLTRAVEESAARRGEDLAAILASLGEDRVNAMTRAHEVEELRAEVRALAEDRL